MAQKTLDDLPEVFVSTTALSPIVNRALRKGVLRKIGPRLYTKNLDDAPERIVRRNLWHLVSSYVPGALVADRTALENGPASDGSIFVIADRTRDVTLPGIVIRPRKGHARLEDDRPFIGDLYLSSVPRAYLENMVASRARGAAMAHTLSRKEIEARLDDVLRRGGPIALNALRDDARRIAGALRLEREFAALDRLIGALLGTYQAQLETAQGKARSAGRPFDPDRLPLFEALHAALRSWPRTPRPMRALGAEGQGTLAFFEAYFSNFIEGTEFAVEEAADIVFRGVIPRARPQDAHDILGTWRVVSDPSKMTRTPRDAVHFLELLRDRHAAILGGRPDKKPGQFKEEANRFGSTVFVAPELVSGTLERGFEFYRSLDVGFARAAFMTFLVSEVHPFADGNGRVARVMMNAELVAEREARILIPTVYRDNYLVALNALSRSGNADPLVRVLDFAERWVDAVPWSTVPDTRCVLEACQAFVESGHAEKLGLRLRLPEPER